MVDLKEGQMPYPGMKDLVLLCGPSLAGKSTLRVQLVTRCSARYVSFDELNAARGLRSGASGLPEREWATTLEIAKSRLDAMMCAKGTIVVDDTLCFRWIRDEIRAIAQRRGYNCMLLYLNPGLEVLRQRMSVARDRTTLAPAVFERHLAAFEIPTADEGPIHLRSPADTTAWVENYRNGRLDTRGRQSGD